MPIQVNPSGRMNLDMKHHRGKDVGSSTFDRALCMEPAVQAAFVNARIGNAAGKGSDVPAGQRCSARAADAPPTMVPGAVSIVIRPSRNGADGTKPGAAHTGVARIEVCPRTPFLWKFVHDQASRSSQR
ncbi:MULTISPECIES: hypothetical protein [Dyella]|uniref:Uncharacterized protein n=2 Tax=Dyella TaxID=231454 RepID=A0A4R0YH60_9GAMM|nr:MULTISPECIES: hypothetical protein [Dyella]TBR37221.1 hypothetical protein EYV96_15180 [Dyella terrae]TCI07689.1 hypothetical protein EZM97_23690 [Dyella soli]